jgi:hypothetical protein
MVTANSDHIVSIDVLDIGRWRFTNSGWLWLMV